MPRKSVEEYARKKGVNSTYRIGALVCLRNDKKAHARDVSILLIDLVPLKITSFRFETLSNCFNILFFEELQIYVIEANIIKDLNNTNMYRINYKYFSNFTICIDIVKMK